MPAGRRGRTFEKQGPGHFQVEKERPSPLAVDENHLSTAAHPQDPRAREPFQLRRPPAPKERRVEEPDGSDPQAREPRPEASDDRFDFRKLGHASIVQECGGSENFLDSAARFD